MAEIIVSVIAKIAEHMVAPVGRQFCYLCHYKTNFEKLRKEIVKLMDARQSVQHLVDDAKRKGEDIAHDVKRWLINVDKSIDEARKFFEVEEKFKNQCFTKVCPNLKKHYQLSKKAARDVRKFVRLYEEGKFDKISYRTSPDELWRLTSTKGYEVFESRMSTLKDILNALSNPSVSMIGVYGMGGVGKTILVKEVARQVKIDKLFDEVVFSEVSQTIDIKKIQGEIAEELGLELREESEYGRARRLRARLKKENKILVVLDNIWASIDLEMIGIPFGDDHKGCKVLLTSRSQDVLSREMDSQNNFLVGVLNENEAWFLFKKMAGNHIENHDLQSVAVDVSKECAGLPIAIVTIARALREDNLFEWRDALLKLRRPSSRNFTGLQAVACSTIELSYNHLKGEELKSTFLICGVLGHTYCSAIIDLLKYGMGLRLFKGVNTMEEAKDRVYTLVHKLKASCLLLDSSTSETFSMHDVTRDVAISIASRDHNVFSVRNDVVPREWLDKDTIKHCTLISLHNADISELPDELECPQLKLLYMYPKNCFLKIRDNFFIGMTELRVLDLTKMILLSLPSSLLLLTNLRTLCLDRCILVDITAVGDLKKLEILSLFSSDIEQLPGEIGQLTQLRVLDLSNCYKLKHIPPNVISRLSKLEELYLGNTSVEWEVERLGVERSNASLAELKHLSHLTLLEIHIQDAQIIPKGLFSRKLERYKIFIGDNWDWYGKYENSRTLKLTLKSTICLETGIISLLEGTQDLHLDEMWGINNVLYQLCRFGFPQLKHLHVQNNPYFLCIVDSMDSVPRAFPLLESLFLHNLINLENICHDQLIAKSSFSKLKVIKVGNCDKMKNIFSFSIAKCLQHLQIIEVTECKNMELIFDISECKEVVVEDSSSKVSFAREPPLSPFNKMDPAESRENKMMTEIVALANEADIVRDDITFSKLKRLSLSYLASLTSFCSGDYTFKFPYLEELIVRGCPNMKIFSQGALSTPRLRKVQLTKEGDEAFWEGNLNATIQQLHEKLTIAASGEDGGHHHPE